MSPQLSRITRLTLRWLEAPDRDTAIATMQDLVDYMKGASNTQEQVDYWMDYSSNMSAVDGETLAEVIETEAILAKMQEQIL
jgi:hypothetical protein